MTGIASIWTRLRKLVWPTFGLVLVMAVPLAVGHAQERAGLESPASSLALPASQAAASQDSKAPNPVLTAARQHSVEQNYLRQPLTFQPNVGQTDKRVQFLSHGAGYSLFLTPGDAVLSLQDDPQKKFQRKGNDGQGSFPGDDLGGQ